VPERTLDVPEEKRRESQGYHDLVPTRAAGASVASNWFRYMNTGT
jgi:hypothetical protein